LDFSLHPQFAACPRSPVARQEPSSSFCPSGQSTPAPCSQTIALTYNVAADTTFGVVNVVTQGAPNLDFQLSENTCSGTVSGGNTCTVSVTFAPTTPGLRMGAVQLLDDSGNLLVMTFPRGIGQGPAIAFGPGVQTTMANGLNSPGGVAVDGAGDLFIADSNNHRVVEVTPGGVETTVPATGLSAPNGVAVGGAGDLFITDQNNNRVIEVTPSGVQTTVPAIGLSDPNGVAVDGAGDLFITDQNNNRVVEITPGGVQTTVPATGLSGFAVYSGSLENSFVAVDAAGDVFIADNGNSQVVEVTPSYLLTTAASPASGGTVTPASGSYYSADAAVSLKAAPSAGYVFANWTGR
jgi:sugar lactone lactonase YvrE